MQLNAIRTRAIADQHPVPLPLVRISGDPEPFPLSALGETLEAAARAIMDRTQAPEAICAQSVLAVASLATQAHADVVLPTGHAKPLSCYFMSVAASGERKSAVDSEALTPVRKHEENLRKAYEEKLPSFLNERDAWEDQRKAVLKKGKTKEAKLAGLAELGPAPKPLLRGILTVSEPTFQGLTKLMLVNQPSLGLFSGEGGSFIGGHAMSDDNKTHTAAGLSELWDGTPIKRVRSGDGTEIIAGRRLSMHLMAQPDIASQMLSDRRLLDQGLLSRMLVSAPRSSAGNRMWKEPLIQSDRDIRHYSAHLLSILEYPTPTSPDSVAELNPRRLPLDDGARWLWVKFADHVERMVGPGGQLEPVRGLANKLPEHAARLAAVLALVESIACREVSQSHMQAGIDIATYYANEACRLFDAGQIDPNLRLAQKTLDFMVVEAKPVYPLATIYQRGPNAVRDAKTARAIMGILEDHGHVERVTDAEVDGARVKEAWRLVGGSI